MNPFPGNTRVYLATGDDDLRKAIDGLTILVAEGHTFQYRSLIKAVLPEKAYTTNTWNPIRGTGAGPPARSGLFALRDTGRRVCISGARL